MADRFNGQFLRTLRALRDHRRFSVVVNGAGQGHKHVPVVNIGDK